MAVAFAAGVEAKRAANIIRSFDDAGWRSFKQSGLANTGVASQTHGGEAMKAVRVMGTLNEQGLNLDLNIQLMSNQN